MAKKQETKANSEVLTELQKIGWFRNISDKFQIGIPDNIGAYRGVLFGIEFKAVSAIPQDGLTPPKSGHVFSGSQIKELISIQDNGLGIGLGMIACGKYLFWFTPDYIDKNGQVNCNQLLKEGKYITKERITGWAGLSKLMSDLWTHHVGKHLAQQQSDNS